ncbi:pimeloyl-CoA synthetase [Primorskyibacter flagellatus]|uniref:Pimeloyl-CoA synthetase n=1 Tax=Primorskyibacter flagellatus TaxID=1387277 RepID=A0A917EDX4_9RHOB|nr:acetate--CoA ligase family protein [Primorskyibacter flagellatus]GGE27621.1 pimeloyl-CoA synthetase [Primorskyibacter flagellatus]
MTLTSVLSPRSVAIVGASDNTDKIGGRPIYYMKRQGYAGALWPINPGRDRVQGLPAFPALDALPGVPDAVVVAVPGQAAIDAVTQSAEMGVGAAVIIASGFGETGPEGKAAEVRLRDIARAGNMRLIGPNSQGLANFGTGAILSFSTMFSEADPQDGPVAIISQSGAMSGVPYGLLRGRGIGVRHVHATGNDCDVTVSELACAVLDDPEVRLLLLYLESLGDPAMLARAAALARARGVPVVALKAGRSERGRRAAASHTGAIATPDRVVDAFFAKHGIWRADSMAELVHAADLYLAGTGGTEGGLCVISSSGASGVLAVDAADLAGHPVADLSPASLSALRDTLPAFAGIENPIDLTGAILSDSTLLPRAAKIAADDAGVGALLVGLPVSGKGYDVEGMAAGAAAISRTSGKPVVLSAAQPRIRAAFAAKGVPVFETDHAAIRALSQVARHRALIAAADAAGAGPVERDAGGGQGRTLSEPDSLAIAARHGVPVVPHRRCTTAADLKAFIATQDGPVVVKAISAAVAHKSDHGLVLTHIDAGRDPETVLATLKERMEALGHPFEGVLAAPMVPAEREIVVGGHVDPVFGPVVMVGDGGIAVEAMPDTALLLPPFSDDAVRQALDSLRIAPLFRGFRGRRPLGAAPLIRAAQGVATMLADGGVHSVDLNPLRVTPDGGCAVDALVVTAAQPDLVKGAGQGDAMEKS